MKILRGPLLALLLAIAPARAEDGSPKVSEVIEAVESAYADVQSLRADFVQVSRSAALGESTQKGEVMLKRPRKMRWAFTQPDDRLFVTDGSKMWVYSKADNQVIVTSEAMSSGGEMPQLLDDLSKLDELFDVQVASGTATSHTLDLAPKKDASFKKLELVISKSDYTLEKMTMTDQFDGVVEITFSKVELNPQLDDAKFSFEVPAGAEVIRSDGM